MSEGMCVRVRIAADGLYWGSYVRRFFVEPIMGTLVS
jgi:hypothetical protein